MSLTCKSCRFPLLSAVCNDRCPSTIAAHQHGRLHLVVAQRLIPMVLFVQIIIEIPQLLDAVADVQLWMRQSLSHSSCTLRKSLFP